MSIRFVRAIAACLAGFVAGAGPATAAEPLRVCLQSHDPPLSSRGPGEGKGFDVALSRLIAERLGRPLAIQWFVTRKDPDSKPPLEASALLSDGHCQLLAGYPLMASALGRLGAPKGKLPPYQGSSPEDRHRWIKLEPLVPSRPYRFDALIVVLSSQHRGMTVRKLADVSGLTLGVQIHGLPDLIAMRYEQGRLADQVVHFTNSAELFEALQSGKLAAAFVDLREFDAWRDRHPDTKIVRSGYTHSIGFNIGFVGIPPDKPLIAAVDRIIADLLSQRALAPLATANGLTWLPPREPAIRANIPLSAFGGD